MTDNIQSSSRPTLSAWKCLLIFFGAIVAIVAEFQIFYGLTLGSAMSDDNMAGPRLIIFFSMLMLFTALIGCSALIGAVIASNKDKEHLSYKLVFGVLRWGFIVLVAFNIIVFVLIIPQCDKSRISSQQSKVDTLAVNQTAYMANLQISNPTVQRNILDSYFVSAEVKNVGNRSLDLVEITVYAKDQDGKRIYEKKINAVYISKYSDTDGPLKPNYSRKFSVDMSEAPAEWSKKIDIEVTGVGFVIADGR